MAVFGLEFSPAALPQLFAVGGMLFLAAALLWLNFNNPANRAFGAFLVLRSLTMLTATFQRELAVDLATAEFWARVLPYFAIPLPFVIVYFLSVYPKRWGWFGTSRWGGWSLVAAAGVLEVLYLLDHGLWAQYVVTPGGHLNVGQEGPMLPLLGLTFLGFGVAALVLAREYTTMAHTLRRGSLLVVCLGFLVQVFFDSTGAFLGLLLGLFVERTWALVLTGLAVVPAALAVLVLLGHAWRNPGEERAAVQHVLVLVPFAVLSNVASFFPATTSVYFLTLGLWRLAFPVLVTYALVRYQLFGIDLTIKLAIKQSTVAAVFLGLFFMVSEIAQEVFSDAVGAYAGIAAAGILVFAITPLQHFAERVAASAMPHALPVEQLSYADRLAIYQEQVILAWEDGVLTRKDRQMLDLSRQQLGLPAADAVRIERAVTAA